MVSGESMGWLTNQGTIDTSAYGFEYYGTLTVDGGGWLNGGSFVLRNSTIVETASPSEPSLLLLRGSGNTLATDHLSGLTLWVQGRQTETAKPS